MLRGVFVSPESLSVDWVTKKIYWSESETNRIELLTYDKQPYMRKVLIYENLALVRALVVDPIHGFENLTNAKICNFSFTVHGLDIFFTITTKMFLR